MRGVAQLCLGIVIGVFVAGWTMPLAALWLAGAVLAASLPRMTTLRNLLVGVFLGLFHVAAQPVGPVLTGWVHLRGEVAGAPSGSRASVRVTTIAHAGGVQQPSHGRVHVRFDGRAPPLGTSVLVWGRAGPAPRGALPGAPHPLHTLRRGRIHTEVRAVRQARVGPSPSPPRHDEGVTGVLTALATGDRSGIQPEHAALFRRTGTAHLLAISGFHVGLVGGLAGGMLVLLLRSMALWFPRGVPVGPATLLAIAGAWTYALSAGAPTSALRAAGLVAVLGGAHLLGHRVKVLHALAVVAAAQVLHDPTCVGTAGFQLSYSAVLGLVCMTPRMMSYVPRNAPGAVRWLAGSLAATIAATAGTLGPASWWLQSLPVLSPFANLFALPLTGLVLVPCALVSTWAPEPVATVALLIGNVGVHGLLLGLTLFDGPVLNPAVGPVGAVVLLALPYIAHRPVASLTLLIAVFCPRPHPHARLTVLDVGQGDALVVDHPDGQTWLVDTGPRRRDVLHYLRRTGRTHLDVVVATHNHPDHIAGLGPILHHLTVDELWVADIDGIEPIVRMAAAQGTRVRVRPDSTLDPDRGMTGNDGSLVMPVLGALLLTGDAERDAEARLASLSVTSEGLKLGHHGSRTSTTQAFVDAVDPVFAVVSAGRNNRYGHPHDEVATRLAARHVPVFSTAAYGTLYVDVKPDRIDVHGTNAGRQTVAWRMNRRRSSSP